MLTNVYKDQTYVKLGVAEEVYKGRQQQNKVMIEHQLGMAYRSFKQFL